MGAIVMFIHGAWLTPRAWDRFAQRYAACGYTCLAPPWPLLEGSPEQLRAAPPAQLGSLGIARIVAHYQALIEALPHPPLLVGHCHGGLFVQMLLDRGLGSAGIAIAPVAPRGVLPGGAALARTLPLLLRGANSVVALSPKQFARNAAQTLSAAQQKLEYQRQVVPAPGRVLYESALGIGTRVDFGNDRRAPLLLIAGENDRTIPTSTIAATFRRHQRSVAVSTFNCFPGRSHWLIDEAGWQEVADYSLEWAQSQTECF